MGVATHDDSGVYRLAGWPGRALVQSVDFFTPIVDDPNDWGRIAAANALSDLYAMGAVPITALQLLGWPRDEIPFAVAGAVMVGGADKMAEAGCVIVGGHSIDDREPTYGFAVTGLVEETLLVTNAGARVGDRLILTKPLGSGIVATAHKAGDCPPGLLAEMVEVMVGLNALAGRNLGGAHAATDVTGYGLLGHLTEMIEASGVGAAVEVTAVPVLDGVRALYESGHFPGGSRRNLDDVRPRLTGEVDEAPILADAQTSGGLLVALPPDAVEDFRASVEAAVEIGEITADKGHILLR